MKIKYQKISFLPQQYVPTGNNGDYDYDSKVTGNRFGAEAFKYFDFVKRYVQLRSAYKNAFC